MERWLFSLFVGILLAIIAAICVMIYEESTSEKIELVKREWACTDSHVMTIMVPVMVGKVSTIVPQTTIVCTKYERIE